MRRRSAGIVTFALAVIALVAILRGLNWLPTAVRSDLLRKYDTVEDARSGSGLGNVFVPAYIPQNLKWPPAILAQGKPFPALVMEFERIDARDTVLVISQSASDALRLDGKIRIAQVKEKARYELKGRHATLEVGTSAAGEPCSRLSWTEGSTKIVVLSKSTPFEMINIAESMIP